MTSNHQMIVNDRNRHLMTSNHQLIVNDGIGALDDFKPSNDGKRWYLGI